MGKYLTYIQLPIIKYKYMMNLYIYILHTDTYYFIYLL